MKPLTAFWKNENTNLSNIVWPGDKFSATAFPIRTEGDNTENILCKEGGRARFQMSHVNGKFFF